MSQGSGHLKYPEHTLIWKKNREVLLLLVENYTQYPAISTWNIVVLGNFWKLLLEQLKFEFRSPTDTKLSNVESY